MEIPPELQSMLNAEHGPTKQKAARLVVDLAASAGASEFTRCAHAHVSGVSVITGGHGLRRFLSDLSGDPEGTVSIPTTLNSAERYSTINPSHVHENLPHSRSQ